MAGKILVASSPLSTSAGSWRNCVAYNAQCYTGANVGYTDVINNSNTRYLGSATGFTATGSNLEGFFAAFKRTTTSVTLLAKLQEDIPNNGTWTDVTGGNITITTNTDLPELYTNKYFTFAAPVATTNGRKYRISLSTSNSGNNVFLITNNTAGNYTFAVVDDASSAKIATDDIMFLAQDVTLTIDENLTTGVMNTYYGGATGSNSTITTVNSGGTKTWTVKGAFWIADKFNLKLHDATTAISLTNKFSLDASALPSGCPIFLKTHSSYSGTQNVSVFEIKGAYTDDFMQRLEADVAIGSNVQVTTRTASGWTNGDSVALIGKAGTANDTAITTISSVPSGTTFNIASVATGKYIKGGAIVNVSKLTNFGVYIKANGGSLINMNLANASSTNCAYYQIEGAAFENVSLNFPISNATSYVKYVIAKGTNAGTTVDIRSTALVTVQYVGIVPTTAGLNGGPIGGPNAVITKLYWRGGASTSASTNSGGHIYNDCVFANGSNSGRYTVTGSKHLYNDCAFLTGDASILLSSAIEITFNNCHFEGGSSYNIRTANAIATLLNCFIGNNVPAFTGDIRVDNDSYCALDLSNTYLGTAQVSNITNAANGSYIAFTDYETTAGDNRTWTATGYFVSSGDSLIQRALIADTDCDNVYNITTGAVSGYGLAFGIVGDIYSANYYAVGGVAPYFIIDYDFGATTDNVQMAENTDAQNLLLKISPTVDNSDINLTLRTNTDDLSPATDADVYFSDIFFRARKYGKVGVYQTKELTKTMAKPIFDIVPLLTDSVITESTEATVAAYTGITINHGSTLITLNGAVDTWQELYDYCSYDISLAANLDKAVFFYSVDGGLSFTSDYDITIDGISVNGTGKTLRMGANTLTLANDGVWTGIVDGAITISDPGTYPINIGSEVVTFAAAGTYDLSGGDISGTIELINTSGGAVTVILAAGVSYTNTGPNITVDIPPVYITVGGIVSGSRLYVYDTVTTTVLYNDIPAGASQQIEITATGNLTKIKLRKAGYKTYETTTTPGAAGASVTASQEADSTYNASYNAGMATDWSINTTTKKLSTNNANFNSVRDWHSYWNDLFAGETYMQYDVPTLAYTKYEMELINGYTFDLDTEYKQLRTGSVAETTTDDLYYSLITIGNATTETVYVSQSGAKLTSWWGAGNVDILVKVKEGGVWIDSGNLEVYCRDFNYIYDHSSVTLSEGGKNYVSLAVGADPNNETASGTVATYNDITLTETPVSKDIGDGTGAHDYLGTIDCANRTKEQVFEYLKYITRNGSATVIDSVAGELFVKLDASYTEVKNCPLAEMVGGLLFAQGWWIENIAAADNLNYVVVDTVGGEHSQPTPPAAITATVLADTRVQVYNVTQDTEIDNAFIAGTSYEYIVTTEAADGDTIRFRACKKGYQEFEAIGIFDSTTGLSVLVSQEEDTNYTTWAIDGETVTEFSADVTGNIEIDANDADGSTTKTRLAAWHNYNLTTENGIRYFFGGITFLSPSSIRINVDVVDLKIENTNASVALKFSDDDVRLYRSDGSSVIAATSYSIQNDYNGVPDYSIITVGGVNVITGDIGDITPTINAIKSKTDYIPEKIVAAKANLNSLM